MDKQIQIYSVGTDAFYNNNEQRIHKIMLKGYKIRNNLRGRAASLKRAEEDRIKDIDKTERRLKSISTRLKSLKKRLLVEFSSNSETRNLNERHLIDRNVISVFESTLTRTANIEPNTLSEDFIVVQTYFFNILEDIIKNGFYLKDEKYICFTASAGQIRTKKTVFVKETVWEKHKLSLMCGLSVESINSKGGININKFLAYLALCNSATDPWMGFDINKAIVVEDMETTVRTLVDFIDEKDFSVTRKDMDIPLPHTDGCGMILPRVNDKSFMVRLPWIKGLLVPFSFDEFVKEHCENNCVIKDIYGDTYDIFKDEIQVIFTKSQFKMWKQYENWADYKRSFLNYRCEAAKCNEEENEFGNAKLNYQMLQTLTDITDEELIEISHKTRFDIENISKNKNTMFKVLGIKKSNKNKNNLQKCVEIYPELLEDTYSKEVLKEVKKSMVTNARAGKLEVNSRYTFIVPDLYAFCEFLFLDNKNPKGILENGYVHCNMFEDEQRVDCLRSPHLYREHALRTNKRNKTLERWFVSRGVYTSVHDPISKILMFDNDGDKVIVCSDKTVVSVAERNMEGIVPLFYNMAQSKGNNIDNNAIYEGLKSAYVGGNIGVISNDITKIWNSNNVNLEAIKWMTAMNNYVIDYAKTLYKPVIPKEKRGVLSTYLKSKVPHFFIYAKKKKKDEVSKVNNSTVNRLHKIVKNPKMSFKFKSKNQFNHRMLMRDKDIASSEDLINKYTDSDLKSHFLISVDEKYSKNNLVQVYKKIRLSLLEIEPDAYKAADILIDYLYKKKNSSYKSTLWECFGNEIYENLKHNIDDVYGKDFIICDECKERVKKKSNRMKYCEDCWKEKQRTIKRDWKRNHDKEKKVEV